MPTSTNRYYAFISYNHKDVKVAAWLHRKLESFKLPTEIHNELDAKQKFLRPVFRDKDELNAGILGNELRDKLEASKYLIVICSRNSAKSEWVSNEVKAFIEMGRLERIIPLMIEDGTDVFPEALREYTQQHPEDELLGVSIPEVGKEKAHIRVVSKMLEVSFDSLWNRHKRQQRIKRALSAAAIAAVIAAIAGAWTMSQPKDVTVHVSEKGSQNTELPAVSDIIVSMDFGKETKVDTLRTLEEAATFRNIPASIIGKEVSAHIEAPHCLSIDTTFILSTDVALSIARDVDVYGKIVGRLYDFEKEKALAGKHVTIAGITAITDEEGIFSMNIPLESQCAQYEVTCSDAEVIDSIIYMPCQNEALINAK